MKLSGIKNWVLVLIFAITVGGSLIAVTVPQYAAAVDSGANPVPAGSNPNPTCAQSFLGFPVWYRGLTVSDVNCDIKSPTGSNGLSNFIWHVVLNIIEDAMILVGYITAFFILYGGFQYLTSMGAPEANAKARTTILNAVIGLVISLVAIGVVNFVVTGILG